MQTCTRAALVLTLAVVGAALGAEALDPKVAQMEAERIAAIEKVRPAVVSVFAPGGQGGGSGVLIDEDGYALTNFHVVAGRGPAGANPYMQCGLADGVLYDAVIAGIDKVGDVAMVRLLPKTDKDGKVIAPKGGKFPFAKLGDSDAVRAGDWSMAMGNPFLLATDFTPTVTFGMVSGVHRYQYPDPNGTLEYTDCIQVDTSINPGNSGGPLFNMKGELIGINGRIQLEKRGRVNVGVGFAISINQIKNFEGHLRAGIETDHASTGFLVAERAEDGAARLTVTEILDDSDAARRGIASGDLMLAFAGRPMEGDNQYKNIVGIFPRGWRVPMKYRHENETRETLVRLMGVIRKEIRDPNKPADGAKPAAAGPGPLPAHVAKLYEARPGYANYHLNKQERDRTLKAFAAKCGSFAGLTGTWTLAGEGEVKGGKGTAFEFKIAEEKDKEGKSETTVRCSLRKIPDLYVLQPLKPGLSQDDLENPPGSGGVMVALMHYRQLLALGEKGFPADGFFHGGTEPFYPAADGPKPDYAKLRVDCDVVGTKLGSVPAKWYFSKKDGTLLGGEVHLVEREKDPCELYFSNYKKVGDRSLPHTIEVRYGKERYALLNLTTFDVK
jgi:S1-C subfamily serine protease